VSRAARISASRAWHAGSSMDSEDMWARLDGNWPRLSLSM
jgi:hypothetical protein